MYFQESVLPLDLSVVVPLHNEEDNVIPLYEAVVAALDPAVGCFELVLIDDGSHDQTYPLAIDLAKRDPRVAVIKLRGNFGQTAAMAIGIRHSLGRCVATMDGDLQNDPCDIPAMLAMLGDDYDLVVGWRHQRQDATLRVLPSKVANWMIRRIMRTQVKDTGCSLKVYRGELIRHVPLYADMHRFIPALASLAGARLGQMQVRHHPRKFGQSKYGYSRIIKVFLDLISIRFLLSFNQRPYAWVLKLALPSAIFGLISLLTPIMGASVFTEGPLVSRSVSVLMFSLSVVLVIGGLVGLLIAETGSRDLQEFAKVAARLSEREHGERAA